MIRISIAAIGLAAFFPSLAAAQCAQQKLTASNASSDSYFGLGLAVDGDTAVVGAPLGDGSALFSGAAYVFDRVGGVWSQTKMLVSSDSQNYLGFGVSTAISGDTAVVGSWTDDDFGFDSGSAFVFERLPSGWTQTAKLFASDAGPDSFFGITTALVGDRLIVGATDQSGSSALAGRVYVFERVGGVWTETAKLIAADSHLGNLFGRDLALSGDRILVGAPGAKVGSVATGAAYVFDFAGGAWTQSAKLSASVANSGQSFGQVVALDGSRALLGAPYDNQMGSAAGAAYLFEESGGVWSQALKFLDPAPATGNVFGFGTSIEGNVLVLGAPGHNEGAADRGCAYVYRRLATGTWLQTQKLIGSNNYQFFATQTAISRDTLFLSADRNNGGTGPNSGACYADELGSDVKSFCVAAPNSTGSGCTLGWSGSTSVAANTFTLTASRAPATTAGLFFYGPQAGQTPFGNGFRCISGGFYRLRPGVVTDGLGSVSRLLDFTTGLPASGVSQITAGSTWFFQLWYRDTAAGGAGFNVSDGLCATFCP